MPSFLPPTGGRDILARSRYLVRHGLAARVGCFEATADLGPLTRGDPVVVRTPRGTELGEVLAATDDEGDEDKAPLLRRAGPDDLRHAERADHRRPEQLQRCQRVLGDGVWPFVLIDVEPLLDEDRVVAYYLGPHGLDDRGLREALRQATGLDLLLEPAGLDRPWDAPPADQVTCGDGGCGSCESKAGCGGCPLSSPRRR